MLGAVVTTRSQSTRDLESASSGEGEGERLAAELRGIVSLVPGDTRHPLLKLIRSVSAVFAGDEAAAKRKLWSLADDPDPWLQAIGAAVSAHLAMNDGDVDAAAAGVTTAEIGFRQIGDVWGLVVTLTGRADVALARDDPATAVAALEEARAHAASALAPNWGEMMLVPLGKARAVAGDLDGARADLERGIEFADRFGDSVNQALGYLELSELARRGEDLAGARRLLEQARQIAEPRTNRSDMTVVAARTFARLGCLAEQEGDLQAAESWQDRALRTLANSKMQFLPANRALAEVVAGFASLAGVRGDHARAAELLGLADSVRGFRDASSLEVARATAAATAVIGEGQFAAGYRRGRLLTKKDALALGG
jgi:tetratricopeptide (TPR) repeat protein